MVTVGGHRRSIAFFVTLGACLVALAVILNVGWIVLNWRTGLLLILGVLFFTVIISGVVLNTTFLVREIRRNEQQDTFINAVTHELKTPLASIRLYLETLRMRDMDEARRQEFYGVMLADSERLLGTIEQVLLAGRASRRHVHRSPIALGEMLEECLALARTHHHLSPECLEYKGSPPATVLGDLDELKAAVSNLLDNAIKYSGPEVRVRVEVAAGVKRVAIRVQDQGVGIPAPELKQIFKRFYRIPGTAAKRAKGMGLGLFIVRSAAEKHGGRAWAESEGAGRGSTFILELPLAPVRPAGQGTGEAPRSEG
ncbi:MAG: HAMP domain-containing histidine kinase [Candidatus Solibacter usitatus]|nr:HAMP domain-containing histidine kinase [Candidatus Solibacter usitatus]